MTAVTQNAAPRPWLVALKDKAARHDRPRDKAFGRWLGDFLNQETPNGLLNTELDLLDACANGGACEPDALAPISGQDPDAESARRSAVEPNRIRGGFLRFLALGGDEFAPIHEAGIELHNALIDSRIDLRGGKCVNRLVLTQCVVLGDLSIEDASLGVLFLRGTRLAGLSGNRAIISGSVFLDEKFVSDGDVSLFSAKITGGLICNAARINGAFTCSSATTGGSLSCKDARIEGLFTCASARIGSYMNCENTVFAGGIAGQGVVIGGDVTFASIAAKRRVSLVGAEIGGSLRCGGATFRMDQDDPAIRPDVMLDASRAKIKGDVDFIVCHAVPFTTQGAVLLVSARIGGDVSFSGARIDALGKDPTDRIAVNGQNIKVEGSVSFGGGSIVDGQVLFSGAEIAKDLAFSDGAFHNAAGCAIFADRSKVSGALQFQTTDPTPGPHGFQSFGEVFLAGAQCGVLNCSGGTFTNPGSMALNGSMMIVAGSVFLGNAGLKPFQANGTVRFHTAQIGQHIYAGGGWFSNPTGEALNGEAAKIAGCVFLNGCDDTGLDRTVRSGLAFKSDGKVTFVGASVGLQFNCQWGRFRNETADRSNDTYADTALDLSTAIIGDTLFLGLEEKQTRPNDPDYMPATIEGAIDLTAATVRVLVDDGLVGVETGGLRPTVAGSDGRHRQCNLKLDLFAYDRLKGDGVYDAGQRMAWLQRQPEERLRQSFLPQPFEQLIKVLRAMGHDDEADEIALSKRTYARKAKPWWSSSRGVWALTDLLARVGEVVFVAWFLGYGYRVAKALIILLVLAGGFGWFYGQAFQQGGIVPADKDIRNDPRAAACTIWSPAACPVMADKAIPLFNPLLYSADVMIPVVGFGQKAAWMPTHTKALALPDGLSGPPNLVYWMQLIETVLGWIGGVLLVSFMSGLIAKE